MALGTTLAKHGGKRYSKQNILMVLDVVFDAAYPAGGYPFDPVALMKSLGGYDKDFDPVPFVQFEQNKGGFQFEFVNDANPANRKLLVRTAAGAEAAGDLSTTPGGTRAMLISC